MNKFLLYFNTIRYLKPIQFRYRIYYVLKKMIRKSLGYKIKNRKYSGINEKIDLTPGIVNHTSYHGNNEFEFLNKKHRFNGKINWNFDLFGKLWTYNLNYFEYLFQNKISQKEGLELIYEFILDFGDNNTGKEAFPTSLRIINWIKFILKNKIYDKAIIDNLYTQVYILYENIEYHLMGNHLLENGFALLYAGIYFGDKKLIEKGEKILSKQLKEQILDDGAHFELSPMYHQLIFYRTLDVLNLSLNSNYNNQNILELLKNKAGLMYSWLENIIFQDGSIPLFNDSSAEIAPAASDLLGFANRLNINKIEKRLNQSGYRKFTGDRFELIVDIGKLGPDYIPGHSHNDMFSFILYIDNKPVIVDTGTSVYGGDSTRRQKERSTSSHNTVQVEGYEQAEIWGDFRVGRRSYPQIVYEKNNKLIVEYRHHTQKYKHRREFIINNKEIIINDSISPELQSVFHLHFDTEIITKIENKSIDLNYCKIEVQNGIVHKEKYLQAKGFGKLISSQKVEIEFKSYLKTIFFI